METRSFALAAGAAAALSIAGLAVGCSSGSRGGSVGSAASPTSPNPAPAPAAPAPSPPGSSGPPTPPAPPPPAPPGATTSVRTVSPGVAWNDVGTPIVISGVGLTGASAATLTDAAGTALRDVRVIDDATMNAVIPAGVAPGTFAVVVAGPSATTAPGGSVTIRNLADPDLPGAFPVGLVDERMSGASGDQPQVRVYYPAMTGGLAAAPDRSLAPYPVVVYSHGFKPPILAAGIDYLTATFITEWLASFGYVVVTVDQAPNNDLFGTAQENVQRDADDVRAALDHLAARAADPADPLFGVMDATSAAAVGHSRGGDASIRAASDEALASGRIRAAVAFGPPSVDSRNGNPPLDLGVYAPVPVLLIGASLDGVAPFADQASLFARAGAGSQILEIAGGNHSQYKDSAATLIGDQAATIPLVVQHDICRRYATALLGAAVRGRAAVFAPYLGSGAAFRGDPRIGRQGAR